MSGADGLTLTSTGNTLVTTFDASGIHANTANDTAANLAVTYVSAYTGTAAETITGGDGNDTLTAASTVHAVTLTGGLGADTLTGGGGTSTIILTEATAARDTVVLRDYTAQAQDIVVGFTAGTAATADAIKLVAAATSAGTTAGNPAAFNTTTTALTTGGAAFDISTAATNTNDIVAINTTLSSFGNLGAAGVVDGTELLKALGSTNVAAASITATTAGGNFYLEAYQNGNAYVYQVASADATINANGIHLVGVIQNVAANSTVANNFTV